jgi:hypothetical protein
MCWHLNQVTSYFISGKPPTASPAPPDGPKRLEAILATGQIPDGIESPAHMLPPADAADSEVDNFIATLERSKSFNGPYPPHRLFGPLNPEQGRTLILMHAARHLSFLVPTTTVIRAA